MKKLYLVFASVVLLLSCGASAGTPSRQTTPNAATLIGTTINNRLNIYRIDDPSGVCILVENEDTTQYSYMALECDFEGGE